MSKKIDAQQLRQNLERARNILKKYPNSQNSLVDELIKDRKEEARKEQQEYKQYAKGLKASLLENEE